MNQVNLVFLGIQHNLKENLKNNMGSKKDEVRNGK